MFFDSVHWDITKSRKNYETADGWIEIKKPPFDRWLYNLSGKRDSNSRPSAWEADALPTELLPREQVQK